METHSEQIGALKAGRALLGIDQQKLAHAAGLSRQMVARMEQGDARIPISSIEAVRRALVSLGVVFIDATPQHGPGVAMSRGVRRPGNDDESCPAA